MDLRQTISNCHNVLYLSEGLIKLAKNEQHIWRSKHHVANKTIQMKAGGNHISCGSQSHCKNIGRLVEFLATATR
jgi:hypothetical protein